MLGSDTWVVEQLSDRCPDVASAFYEDTGHLVESLRWFDLVDRQLHRGLVGRVEDVVYGTRQSEQVLTVEWGRVCMRQLVDQDSSFGVALALDLLDLFDQVGVCRGLAAELFKRLKSPDREVGLVRQQLD